jgi:hypothetical protein
MGLSLALNLILNTCDDLMAYVMLMQLNEYWIESKWLTKALLKKHLIDQLGDQV